MVRVDILAEKGGEEVLGVDFYRLCGGTWIEDEGPGVRIKCYPPDPDRFLALLGASDLPLSRISTIEEEEQDYVALVRRHFTPVTVGGLTILPPWHKPRKKGRTIFIEPGMAFGTGRHESTKLMITMMGERDLRAKKVLDIGSGSGILSVYAALLGASPVVAVDHDPLAAEATQKACGLNHTPHVLLACAGLEAIRTVFDVVLANLDFTTFEGSAAEIARMVGSGGYLLVSGIEAHYARRLPPLFRSLALVRSLRMADWRGYIFAKTPRPT